MKISKLVRSRDNWKEKAKFRGTKMRGFRRTIKANDQRLAQSQQKIDRLENEVRELRAALNERGLPAEGEAVIQNKTLCVIIIVCGIVSFRSVPRILQIFQPLLRAKMQIPHFTSVINWTLRAGVSVFKQVSRCSEPWVAIIDCSIDIGTRKALLVLRVALDTLQNKHGAIGPRDCECIGLEVSHKWNGELVCDALTRIFGKSGIPNAIIKDGGTDLNKGVELFRSVNTERNIHTIDDVGHFAANALKALFATSKSFIKFLEITSKAAARIRQTNLAGLLPPKIRSKGRFQGITKVAKWAQQILDLIGGKGRAAVGSDVSKLRKAFSGLATLRPFLKRFCHTCNITDLFLELMKTEGLNESTYITAKNIVGELSEKSLLRTRLSTWLEKHINIHRALSIGQMPLIVSSDAIESLFGIFKTIIQRNPRGELNRLIYVIPLICGNHSYHDIDNALSKCSHSEMLSQIQQTVPQTLRQQRAQKLSKCPSPVPKSEHCQGIHTG